MSSLAQRSVAALERAIGALPVGEPREGQFQMCEAVAEAIEHERHLLVEAGTGVGKSLAYLVPALLSGRRVVVATATKALQDQLVRKDVPFVAEHLDVPVEAAVLKGRRNYLCRARLAEGLADGEGDDQLRLVPRSRLERLPELAAWAETATSGERDDLPFEVSSVLWDALTVGPRECPGANGCPHAGGCFAERARERARLAGLVILNAHLYCLDLAIGSAIVGEHEVAVVDEAHTLEETAAAVFGATVTPGRLTWLARQLRGVLVREAREIAPVERAATAFERALQARGGQRVEVARTADLADALTAAGEALARAMAALRSLDVTGPTESRRARVLQAAGTLAEEVRLVATPAPGTVTWVEKGEAGVALRMAPVDAGPLLAKNLFADRTVVLTSATLSVGGELEPTAWALGLRDGRGDWTGLNVPSSFDYRRQSILYCAAHLADPRHDAFEPAAIAELAGLVEAAGGRTLALFTSWRAMVAAANVLRERWNWPVLVQGEAIRGRLLERFREDERSCLFATMTFWQGVDVPGPALRLVVIDKIPFPRPDEPLHEARREAAADAGRDPFATVDLPRAARLLAQGAGRLIRTADDAGAVAVLDRRLARARYRTVLLDSLPPMHRSVDGDEVREFLRALDDH